MFTVMVTGGIGSGKSTVCRLLGAHGAATLDMDGIARSLMDHNLEMRAQLVDEFGARILDEAGEVDRAALARVAFTSPAATDALNAITFPHITRAAADYLTEVHCSPRSAAPVQVVEVPLLTQVPEFAVLADAIISVNCPSDLRLSRAIARGMSAEDALARMAAQPTDDERNAIATHVLHNAGTLEELQAAVDEWWQQTEGAWRG